MSRIPVALLRAAALLAAPAVSAADVAGRWQGAIEIPGDPVSATIDLDHDAAGAWIGSITLPELGVQGAALADIAIKDGLLSFTIKEALARPPDPPAGFSARLGGGDVLTGTFTQAGNRARFEAHRAGPAQVDLPPASTPVAKELEGTWTGDYELMGYARHVTLKLANHAGAPASADFVIVGKKTNHLGVDYLAQDGDYLRVESHGFGINLEGRWQRARGAIDATYQQGPFEVPFVLHRSKENTP